MIIRTPTEAKGGITDKERELLKAHADKWVANALQTGSVDREALNEAIKRLYTVSGLKEPRIVVVPSPRVMALAGGIAAAWWYLRKSATTDATLADTLADTRDATDTDTLAVIDATLAATLADTLADTRDATDTDTLAVIDAATDATLAVIDAATDATLAATLADTLADTLAAIDAATDTATRAATRAAIDAATDATLAATSATTRATSDATDAATLAAIDDAEWLAGLAVKFCGRAAPLALSCIRAWWNMRDGGNMWSGWPAYLSAFRDVLGLKLPIYDKFHAYEDCAKLGSLRLMHEEFCMVSDFPELIKMDERHRPHCIDGPSHRWRDGWELFHLWGVRVEKEMLDLCASEILKIKNAEQRMVLIKRFGIQNMLIELGSKTIDRRDDLISVETSHPVVYELLSINIEGRDCRFLKMTNPSTGEIHVEGKPYGTKTVVGALAWAWNKTESDIINRLKFAA